MWSAIGWCGRVRLVKLSIVALVALGIVAFLSAWFGIAEGIPPLPRRVCTALFIVAGIAVGLAAICLFICLSLAYHLESNAEEKGEKATPVERQQEPLGEDV